MQADCYRRYSPSPPLKPPAANKPISSMRTHLFFGDRSMKPSAWHDETSRSLNKGHTWAEFTPYSNVIWLRYLLSYLIKTGKKQVEGGPKTMSDFTQDTKELQSKLHVRTLPENGAFSTAQEVLEYVAQKGWVSQEQLEAQGVDSTFLSEPATEEN